MPILKPVEILRCLEGCRVQYVVIGGVAATLHGSPLATHDVDVCPASDPDNLARLAEALKEMGARLRAGADAPEGVPFPCKGPFLAGKAMWNLVTPFGDFDVSFEPSGTGGYESLALRAVRYDLGEGLVVPVAALEDVVRSKEAANREKDRQALPTLRLLLEKTRKEGPQRPTQDVWRGEKGSVPPPGGVGDQSGPGRDRGRGR